MINTEQRKALVWFRARQPTPWRMSGAPHRVFQTLVKQGLIALEPDRKYGDPMRFVLTEAGKKALEP